MPSYSTCPWCETMYVQDTYSGVTCAQCAHRADLPRVLCDCPACCLSAALVLIEPDGPMKLPDIPFPPLQLGSRMGETVILVSVMRDGFSVSVVMNDKPNANRVVQFTRMQQLALVDETIDTMSAEELEKARAKILGRV